MKLKSIQEYNVECFKYFKCGENQLDYFLKKYALENDKKGYGKTFILEDDDLIVGYFTICSAQIRYSEYKELDDKSLPKYPVPCIKIARLAVNKKSQNKGYGRELLKQAFIKSLMVSEIIGAYLIILDAKASSFSFYEHYGFKKLCSDSLIYFMKVEWLKNIVGQTNSNS